MTTNEDDLSKGDKVTWKSHGQNVHGTVEEKILGLQQRKRELAAGVLGTDADVGKLLTEDDVAELFRGD